MNILKKFENWKVLSIIKKHPVRFSQWKDIRQLACISHMSAVEKARLRVLTSMLLQQKIFVGVQGLELSSEMKLLIATQACVPILKLGLNYYSTFTQISVYPTAFWVEREIIDASGVIHTSKALLAGEAWSHGPVILSWDDIMKDLQEDNAGHNVIIHEFVHKIDMLNTGANGVPPFSANISSEEWGQVFRNAFERLSRNIRLNRKLCLNAYGATSPAEFFAVVSEYFFTNPQHLSQHYPKVYHELTLFYGQDRAE
ncbi:MAG TPA: zinc-dependent peptidase [Gammaproteobacteria bacterium]|nr:zinc-dependent peptidase [Gammaproteobacteria bacterium]